MSEENVVPDRKRGEEFLAAQRDPAWIAWLGDMDAVVTNFVHTEFADTTVDPFSADGLLVAEARALERFGSIAEFKAEENGELADQYVRYLGEVFVRNFDGRWVNILQPTKGLVASVEYPYPGWYLNPRSFITAALHRRTGKEWAFVFGNEAVDYAKWTKDIVPPAKRTLSWAL